MPQPIRTEELLNQAGLAAQGQMPAGDVIPLTDQTLEATRARLEQFRSQAREDILMPDSTRDRIGEAMEGYLESLAELREALTEEDPERIAQAVALAQKKVEATRAAQDAHRAALTVGSTSFPYLNRLLAQAAEGSERQRQLLQKSLQEAPAFLHWLRRELSQRPVSPLETHAVFELQELLAKLGQGAEPLPGLESQIAEVSGRIAGLLKEPATLAEAEGPTPIGPVNQILDALSSFGGAPEELRLVVTLLGECRDYLRRVVPPAAPPAAVAALGQTVGSLDRMERALRELSDFEELEIAAGELEATAQALVRSLPVGPMEAFESDEFLAQTRDLSPFYQSILRPAYAYLAGKAPGEAVLGASEHMENLVSHVQREALSVPSGDPRLALLEEALEQMRETAETLRALVDNPDPNLLQMATTLAHQASQRISQAQA